jgi:hypothetical protein
MGPFGLAQAQTKLKWAHVYETSEPYHKWSVWAGEEFKKRTNGKYEIQVFPASSLGKESDINQGLQLGTVDIILSGCVVRLQLVPAPGGELLPVHLPRRRPRHQVRQERCLQGADRGLQEGHRQHRDGAHLLRRAPRHQQQAVQELRRDEGPQDARARCRRPTPRCRAPAAPTRRRLPLPRSTWRLQNGTVDAQENPLPTIEAKKFFEVQKNIILTGHIVRRAADPRSPSLMGKLTPAEQKLLTDITQEAAEKATNDIRKREGELVDEFKKKGNNVVTVDRKTSSSAC